MTDFTLAEHGIAIIPFCTAAELAAYRADFDAALLAAPEYKPPPAGTSMDDLEFVGGGTAFVGGSVCHSLAVRRVEEHAYRVALATLRAEGERLGMPCLAQIKDRLCVRPRGKVPSAETAHRDLSPYSPTSEVTIFGGWVPLNDQPGQEQYFSCVPGSQNDVCANDSRYSFTSLTKDEAKAYGARMQRIKIPLGHMLVFNQCLVHEVVGDSLPYAIRRVFTAFELAKPGVQPILRRLGWSPAQVANMFRTQGPFLIKSGQECRSFPKTWPMYWKGRLDAFSKKRVRKWTRDPATGRVRTVFPAPPERFRHPAYTEDEMARFAFIDARR